MWCQPDSSSMTSISKISKKKVLKPRIQELKWTRLSERNSQNHIGINPIPNLTTKPTTLDSSSTDSGSDHMPYLNPLLSKEIILIRSFLLLQGLCLRLLQVPLRHLLQLISLQQLLNSLSLLLRVVEHAVKGSMILYYYILLHLSSSWNPLGSTLPE